MMHGPEKKARKVRVGLNVTACESATGIEFERVRFETVPGLDADELEAGISRLPGCQDMGEFFYESESGRGRFITICGIPRTGEYAVLPEPVYPDGE